MELNRREFLVAASVTLVTGCGRETSPEIPATQAASTPHNPLSASDTIIDAGPVTLLASDGVYDTFREKGFFLIRRGKTVFALSAICTHKGCRVRAQQDRSFLCKCHGSAFDPDGRVLSGPARRNLPRLAVRVDEAQHLFIDVATKYETT